MSTRGPQTGAEQLHANFAGGLQALIEQRGTETEAERLERELCDPETSFIGALRDAARIVSWYKPNEPAPFHLQIDDSIVDFEFRIGNTSAASARKSKWADEIFGDENAQDRGEDFNWEFYQYAALSTARKLLNEPDALNQATGLLVAARIAAFNLPENYQGEKPKRHKQETIEDVLFRKAHLMIREKVSKVSREERTFLDFFESIRHTLDTDEGFNDFISVLIHPDAGELRQGHSDVKIEAFARDILEILAREQTTPESIAEEAYKIKRLRELKRETPEPGSDTVTWEILPPEAMEEIEKTGETGQEAGKDFVDPERLKWLARLAIDWGNDAYIVVSSLKDSQETSNQYYAAILPGQSSGAPVEHAVAENASSRNATYVFRAERGLNEDGSTWLTWRDVLSDSKSGARALGARKILHNCYWSENVEEYLTRPTKDLDKQGYKR